jgi:hypothetical protein
MMQPNVRTVRLEAVAYLVILLGAAWVRLAALGWPPLSDTQASQALAASALAGNPSPFDNGPNDPPPGVAYRALTSVVFQLFGSSDAAARVLPALSGVVLCLLPLLARQEFGPRLSIVLAALFALSPVMVTVSRQAGGTMLACLGLFGFIILLTSHDPTRPHASRATGAVAFAALAVTSGPAWVPGAIGLLLGFSLTAWWRRGQAEPTPGFDLLPFTRRDLTIGLLFVLALSTGLGLYPGGAADAFESLAAWFSRWSTPATMSLLSELLVIPIYEPLFLVFGLIGLVISFRRRVLFGVLAAFWALGAWIVALINPGRSALDLVWVAIPVAYLAGQGLLALIEGLLAERDLLRFAGMSGAFVALAAFIGLQLAAYARGLGVEPAVLDPGLRLGIILVAALILIVLVVLFGTGWSWASSATALGVAAFGVLSAVSISSLFQLNFSRQAAEGGQLWQPRVAAVGLRELEFSLNFLSRAYRDDPGGLTITVQGSAPPSLVWAIRGFEQAPASATDQAPPVVLAPSQAEPSLRADYLGQRLAIAEVNDWDGALPPDALSWLIFRHAQLEFDDWVLLVRADVATQGGLTALGSEANP